MSIGKVALVTGANRGIGFEICRQLCQQWKGTVILAARNKDSGLAAVAKLAKDGLSVQFMQMDISSQSSVQNALKEFKSRYEGLDILINNAGILQGPSAIKTWKQTYADQVQETLTVNYFGLLNVCNAFFPLLRPHGRVVHLSSTLGNMGLLLRDDLQKKFCNPNLTVEDLSALMDAYERHVKNGDHEQHGWPSQPDRMPPIAYGVSKIAVTTLANIQSKQLLHDSRQDILVNACCPGWVQTDMGGMEATRTVQQGASGPVYLALLPEGKHNGVFYKVDHVDKFFTY